jgi:hypothetical protein
MVSHNPEQLYYKLSRGVELFISYFKVNRFSRIFSLIRKYSKKRVCIEIPKEVALLNCHGS